MVFAGEKVTFQTSTKWLDLVDLKNWYGPAEASVATFSSVKHAAMGSIGRSSRFGRTWLVEPQYQEFLAPVGSIGEICIEGGIVSNGYVGEDVDQSQNAFVCSDFLQGTISQVYRTGDYGKYDIESGEIIFLGRREDALQKLRGQRIRLDDVEARAQEFLKGTFTARVVVDVMTPLNSDAAILVLFVSPTDTPTSFTREDAVEMVKDRFPLEDLEKELSTTLPLNHIPRLCIPIVELPIGPTGKIDRRRLRQWGNSLTLEEMLKLQPHRRELRKPSTTMEKGLQKLWAHILNIDPEAIHADDHFFRLGGDSISAIRLVSMARDDRLRLKFTAAMIFDHPKLSDMAVVAVSESHLGTLHSNIPPFSLLPPEGVTPIEARNHAAKACRVPPSEIADIYPTSPLQAGLLAMTAKTSGKYVSRSVLRLQDDIEPDRLVAAWSATVERMPILRTRMIDLGGTVMQVVLFNLPIHRADDVEEYVHHDERRSMGFGTELCRAALIERHVVLTIHHGLYDGSSLPIILDTMRASYQNTTLPPITPYQRFIKYLTTDNVDASRTYWKGQLSNTELQQFPVLPSPRYIPQADQRMTYTIPLSWPRLGITPSTILRSAWARVTSQYTNSLHVVFGATVSGRQADVPGIDRVGGPTVSTVPIAVSLDMNDTLQDHLQRMQKHATAMVPHEQYGLQHIQALTEDRERSLFQALLVVQPLVEEEDGSLEHDGYLFKARSWAASVETKGTDPFNTYALMLVCVPSQSGLQLTISYDRTIMSTSQVDTLAAQFETVLQQMCVDGSPQLCEIHVASPRDLAFYWQQNAIPPHEPTMRVHDLVTRRASQQPYDIAIDAWDGRFSYREVDEMSTLLSRKLINLGVTPGSVVLLSLERSKWVAVLQLAVLKAGGIALLQSTHVPEGRLVRILQSVPAVLAITSTERKMVVGTIVRSMTPEQLVALKIPPTSRSPPIKMSAAAAVLVSSGSTGEPKAILWSHTTLTANVHAFQLATGLDENSRLFSFCSYDFDVCSIEMMATLAHGGRLCIPSQGELHNGMSSAIRYYESNIASLTPSASTLIHPDEVPCLATVVLAGESLTPERVAAFPDRRVINWYGPCECSPGSFCDASDGTWYHGVIGKTNSSSMTRCWLVDPLHQDSLILAARGALGEIVLEGPACAVGYLGVDAPRGRFQENPPFLTRGHGEMFPGRTGRVFRTGDLARFDSEGMLVFKGRKDYVLKIRGQFVSPEEVEFHIRRLLSSCVKGVEVVVDSLSREGSDVVHLVAYIASDMSVDEAFLHASFIGLPQELGTILPSFAVPTLFIPLPTLPLTSTGKVNRLRLQELGKAFEPRNATLAPKTRPQNKAEITLQSLWADVLRLDPESISRNDSFLQLGDSVQAMRMVGLAQRRRFSLTVADVFRHPVLRDMARCLTTVDESEKHVITPFSLLLEDNFDVDTARIEAASMAGVAVDDVEDMYPCTPLQEGLLALTLKHPGSYIGLNVLKITPTVDLVQFKKAWEEVVQSTAILRTRIVHITGKGLFQIVIRGTTSWSAATTVEAFVSEGGRTGLGTPLARYGLFTENGGDDRFCLELHHSSYDGKTLQMIREALEQRYRGETPSPLQPFSSFISYIINKDEEEETRFWEEQFQDLEAPIWPALAHEDYTANPTATHIHVIEDVAWRTDGYTSSTIIRAAFSLLVMKYTDSSDVVFGAIVSGRKAAVSDIEHIAGPTISTIPVRVRVGSEQTLGSLLSVLQQQEIDSIEFEQTGLSRIRHVSDEARRACRFQSAIVIQPEEIHMSAGSCFADVPDEGKLNADTFASFNVYGLMVVCTLRKDPSGKSPLRLEFCFDEKMVDSVTISHLAEQLEQALKELNHQSLDSHISGLNLVPTNQLEQIWQWNHTPVPSHHTTIHDIITEISLHRPNDLAISAWDGEFRYGELDLLSSRIARRLVDLGVQRGMIVPICFEKSKFNTVACISVMKAGGAILMLDATQPEGSLQAILRRVEPAIILSSAVNESLCGRLAPQVVTLSELDDVHEEAGVELPLVEPSQLLFVIPTSGSTGKCIISLWMVISSYHHTHRFVSMSYA